MLRADLRALSRLRLREARRLLQAPALPAGAYYLAGYAVECGLKACIARRTRRFEFPDQKIVNASYTHDLTRLVRIAGLEANLNAEIEGNAALGVNWTLVKDWTEESRYDHSITLAKARDLYRAITNNPNGVIRWIHLHW